MAILIDGLRGFWVPGIASIREGEINNLSDWLKFGRFYVKDVISSDRFILEVASADDAADLFAATANRTLVGCFESIVSIEEVRVAPKSLAWMLVKLYYSAYFAAHSHMRICGWSCVNLEVVDATRVFDLADASNSSLPCSKINSGIFYVRFDAASREIHFEAAGTKRSHEALWEIYKKFLVHIRSALPNVLVIDPQRKFVESKIDAITKILCLKGANGGNWLSRVRNSVQYRYSHGVWYPYDIKKAFAEGVIGNVEDMFLMDPDKFDLAVNIQDNKAEIRTFSEGALFMSAIARGMALDMAARSSSNSSLSRRGAAKFLKICNLD